MVSIIKSQPDVVAVSLGGGVQSTVMLMMGGSGSFDLVPDVAIFADTGNEPPEVYEMIDWLQNNQPVPIEIVRAKQPILEALRAGTDYNKVPMVPVVPTHVVDKNGKQSLSRRICTYGWKVVPIQREMRRYMGVSRVTRSSNLQAQQWLGITIDEIERVSVSKDFWIENRYPLVEREMSRQDCLDWWENNAPVGAPPLAKSACIVCPYHTSSEWALSYLNHPEMIEEAAEAERLHQQHVYASFGEDSFQHYFNRRGVPLLDAVKADLQDALDRESSGELFARAEECDGICWT